MKTDYVLLVCLYFLGLAMRAAYEQLKKSGRVDPKNRIVFATVFLAMCFLWASWFSMCPLDPLQLPLPQVARWTGFVAFLAGLVLANEERELESRYGQVYSDYRAKTWF